MIKINLELFPSYGRDIARSTRFSKTRSYRRTLEPLYIYINIVYKFKGIINLVGDSLGPSAKKEISDCFSAKKGV